MASTDWSTTSFKVQNVSYSLVDTLGLDMDQNYCWNVRTTAASTTAPAYFSVFNSTIGVFQNTDTTPKTNLKLRALMRKNAVEAHPFLFLRSGNASTSTAFKLVFRQSGHLALYKEAVEGGFTTTPILVSGSTYSINQTYHIEFSIFSQPNGDTFIEAYLGDRSPYEVWTPIFKTMIFYSDMGTPPMYTGYVGFGHYSVATGANSYFDLFEAYQESTT